MVTNVSPYKFDLNSLPAKSDYLAVLAGRLALLEILPWDGFRRFDLTYLICFLNFKCFVQQTAYLLLSISVFTF